MTDAEENILYEERMREQQMLEEAEAEEEFLREAMRNYDFEYGDWKY